MDESILRTIKKLLGQSPDDEGFNEDCVVFVNTALATLADIGVGPKEGFSITGPDETWSDLLQGEETLFQDAKSYVFLKARLLFDPPSTSYRITLYEDQLKEILTRMEMRRDKIAHPWPLKEEPWLIVT